MDLASLVNQVDLEHIYKHVLALEGVRNPIDSPGDLEKAADYVYSILKDYGAEVSEQKFKLEGFEGVFRNIEGVLGNDNGAELLIVSHYDTVMDSPGANDNASGVGAMLEAANVLADVEDIGKIRFVCFSLEERNPVYILRSRDISQSLGLVDGYNRYTSAHSHKILGRLYQLQIKAFSEGKNHSEAISIAKNQLLSELNEPEKQFIEELEKMYSGVTVSSWPGKTGLVGSGIWVAEACRAKKEILGVLCLETIGYTSDRKGSQTLPENMDPSMFQTYNVPDVTIGNFLTIVGDVNSTRLAESFCTQSKLDSIELPYACLLVPLSFNDITMFGLQDLLRSDHAPFWREEIPGLMLTDTANFRYPYYHTQADTIDKLDFTFITKICKATIATAIDLTRK